VYRIKQAELIAVWTDAHRDANPGSISAIHGRDTERL